MTKVHPIFNAAYKGLNNAQKQAVDAINGPVMVVAGPGTGKTQILTLRIANILLKTDTPPDGILALTFTEAGVTAMKKRLIKLIGPTAYRVRIHTFHGFCNDIIHDHPERFRRITGAQNLTDIEAVKILRDIIRALDLEKLKPFNNPYEHVKDIRAAIGTLKREGKSPGDVAQTCERLIREVENDPESLSSRGPTKGQLKADAKNRIEALRKEHELGRVYAEYEIKLREAKRFDYEDMILEVVRAFATDADFCETIRSEYLYVLADEHQDANDSQNKLLEYLAGDEPAPNLFIVGDEKQAIFRFQGAGLDNFDRFARRFADARLVRLTESYRSGQRLLDAAYYLMTQSAHVPAERHPRLESRVEEPHLAALESRVFSTEEMEILWVAQDIRRLVDEGVPAGDIAVIFRNNKDAIPVSRALSQKSVLHMLDSRNNVFENIIIKQLVTYLRLCMRVGNDTHFAHVLHFPWTGISAHDAYKIMWYAGEKRLPYIEVMTSREHLDAARAHDTEAALSLAQTVQRLARAAQEETVRDFFYRLLHESGLLDYVLKRHDVISVLDALRGFSSTTETLAATKTLYTGRDFVEDLALYEEYGIEIAPDTIPRERTSAVHLVTAHGSKGLEYEYVYLIHARDKKWGNNKKRDMFRFETLATVREDGLEDERRLFYVALTRAKKYASVSYGVAGAGRKGDAAGTQFMQEIDPALVTQISEDDIAAFETSVPPEAAFALRAPELNKMDDSAFLSDAFLEQGLSATALNNYLDCPWKYFYRNLLRVPDKPTPSLLYGNAMHRALQDFRNACKQKGEYLPFDLLREFMDAAMENQGFSPEQLEDAKRKGERALHDWYERNRDGYEFNVQSERGFQVYMPLEHTDLQTVLLRGKLDVIQFNTNGSISVIDYKTGQHQSRNKILGETADSNGDYKRQLDFYCILMELGQMERPSHLILEFIEPDKKTGKTVIHEFAYDADAVVELKKTIERVSGEIYTLAFWDKKCDTEDCEYCALREMMRI